MVVEDCVRGYTEGPATVIAFVSQGSITMESVLVYPV